MKGKLLFKTPEDTSSLDDIRALCGLLSEEALDGSTPEEIFANTVGGLTIGYYDNFPVCLFVIEESKKTVELHGMVRPDLKYLLGKEQSILLKKDIYKFIFDGIFHKAGKKSILVKVPKGNRGVLGFVLTNGFKKLQYNNKGRSLWVLSREEYSQE